MLQARQQCVFAHPKGLRLPHKDARKSESRPAGVVDDHAGRVRLSASCVAPRIALRERGAACNIASKQNLIVAYHARFVFQAVGDGKRRRAIGRMDHAEQIVAPVRQSARADSFGGDGGSRAKISATASHLRVVGIPKPPWRWRDNRRRDV